jgi:hypothetical protein
MIDELGDKDMRASAAISWIRRQISVKRRSPGDLQTMARFRRGGVFPRFDAEGSWRIDLVDSSMVPSTTSGRLRKLEFGC